MFFGKEKEIEKLKKEIKDLKKSQEIWDINMYVANIIQGTRILLELNILTDLDTLTYINKHLMHCVEITARNMFSLKGFELNSDPSVKEEYISKMIDISTAILNIAKENFVNPNITNAEKKVIAKNLNFAIINQIKVFASPSEEFNISDF